MSHPQHYRIGNTSQSITYKLGLRRWTMPLSIADGRQPSTTNPWPSWFKRLPPESTIKWRVPSELPQGKSCCCLWCVARGNEKKRVAAQCWNITSPCPVYYFLLKPAHLGDPKTLSSICGSSVSFPAGCCFSQFSQLSLFGTLAIVVLCTWG